MNFFKNVIANLMKYAEEATTSFSVIDPTAVGKGSQVIRTITLTSTPIDENESILSLFWDGSSEKVFEKKLSNEETKHIFDLMASDLSEAHKLVEQGNNDGAKTLLENLLKKYAVETGDIVETNLPALHNTQAKKEENVLWKQSKITMQNLWFSTTNELLEYQEKQKGAKSNQDHIPLWDAQKGKDVAPKDELAPASLSYEDLENSKERDHEDMTKHIDEKIKTELESALQEKAASVFGPADIELVKSLRAPGIGRNWDEIKKIFIKDLNRDKDATTIFLDEQRQSLDPAGIEVEPVKEEPESLRPPKELVPDSVHEKLLQDHEDKKKIDSPVEENKELNFTPKDVMDIPEDEEIEEQSALISEISRADNDEIHKVAAPSDLNPLQAPIEESPTMETPKQDVIPMSKPLDHNKLAKGDRVYVASEISADEKTGFSGTFISEYNSKGEKFIIVETDQGDLLDVAAIRATKVNEGASGAQDTEPAMEPEIATQKEQDISVTPKMDDFHTSSKRINNKISLLKQANQIQLEDGQFGWDFIIKDVTTGETKLIQSDYDYPGIASTFGWAPCHSETDGTVDCPVCGKKASDLIGEAGQYLTVHVGEVVEDPGYFDITASKKLSSQDPLLAIKLEAEALLKEVEGMGKTSYIFIRKGLEKHADDSAFEGNGWCRVWVQEDEIASDSRYPEILKLPDENAKIAALKELARELAQEALRLADSAGAKVGVQSWFDSLKPSDHDRIDWVKLANPQAAESSLEPKVEKIAADGSACIKCNKVLPLDKMVKNEHGAGYLCKADAPEWNKEASDFEKGISQNKTSADPVEAPKVQYKDYKITPKYAPKEQAIPATPELADVLAKMDSLQSNLSTLEAARKQIQAKMKEELDKIDQTGERVQMEAALQESVEKAAVLIQAVESKVVQWKDKLYTLQTENIQYVPKLTPKEMLEKIYAKFSGAEKYVQDVLNGMLSQGKNVLEKTLIQWPNKKSSTNKEASVLDDMNHYNDELLAALKELSTPL